MHDHMLDDMEGTMQYGIRGQKAEFLSNDKGGAQGAAGDDSNGHVWREQVTAGGRATMTA